jgi:tetratricopeptide (TPR) repeat protein
MTTPSAPSVESLLKRGNVYLKDGEFDSAGEYFDRVLDIDPECAKAYLGLLMVETKISDTSALSTVSKPLTEYGNYKRALRFADDEFRTVLERFCVQIPVAVVNTSQFNELVSDACKELTVKSEENQSNKEESYNYAVALMRKAQNDNSHDSYQVALIEFEKLSGFKDSNIRAVQCRRKMDILEDYQEEAPQEDSRICCNNCGSDDLNSHTESDTEVSGGGYGCGSGCCGSILLGPIGLLCGLCGRDIKSETTHRLYWVCRKCGNKQRDVNDEKEEDRRQAIAAIPFLGIASAIALYLGFNDISLFDISPWIFTVGGIIGLIITIFAIIGIFMDSDKKT